VTDDAVHCPRCGRPFRLPQLREEHLVWCGWDKEPELKGQVSRELLELPLRVIERPDVLQVIRESKVAA
jgi:hypothetical protein